jgi:hypothetical protein
VSAPVFLRALVSAAGAGAACWLLAPAVDARFVLVAGAAAQLAATAPSRRRGLAAAALCGGLGLGVLALRLPLAQTALLGAALFGACRSGFLFRQRPARALAVEALLLAGGLALAGWLAGPWPSLRSLALGCWGFWLVQSAYFLVGGVSARSDDDAAAGDAFERARSRILALLD